VRPTPYPAKGDLPSDAPAHTHFRHLQAATTQGRRRGRFLYFNNNPSKKYFASDSSTGVTKQHSHVTCIDPTRNDTFDSVFDVEKLITPLSNF